MGRSLVMTAVAEEELGLECLCDTDAKGDELRLAEAYGDEWVPALSRPH